MIPENIKQLANKVRDEIYGRDVRESIAQSMEVSGETSNEANERSKDTATRQTDIENRFDDQIAGNTDIDEVIDARRPEGGESYPTLRKRLDDEHKEVTTQLAQTQNEIADRLNANLVLKPDEFSFSPPFNIYYIGDKYVTDYDIKAEAPKGVTYYVSPKSGDDTNTGLSPNNAFRRIETALEKEDVDVIALEPGVYTRAETSSGIMRVKRSVSLICENGRAEISKHDNLTFTQNTTHPYVYQSPLANVLDVLDTNILDKNGDYTILEKVSTVSQVNQKPNSYALVDGILYVRTADSRALTDDNSIRALRAPEMFSVENDVTFYLENIDIVGGSSNIRTTVENTRILAKNCSFKYAGLENALTILGGSHIFQKCVVAKAMKDGFNYHKINTNVGRAIEIDCIGRNNGRDGSNFNNGSSNHDGGSTIRINGEYYENEGLNIADIAECEQWNLGSVAHSSRSTNSFRNSNFYSACRKAYLERCKSYGSENDLTVEANGENTSETYLKYFYSTGKQNIKDNAEVSSY